MRLNQGATAGNKKILSYVNINVKAKMPYAFIGLLSSHHKIKYYEPTF